jgi:hypothetical protein
MIDGVSIGRSYFRTSRSHRVESWQLSQLEMAEKRFEFVRVHSQIKTRQQGYASTSPAPNAEHDEDAPPRLDELVERAVVMRQQTFQFSAIKLPRVTRKRHRRTWSLAGSGL